LENLEFTALPKMEYTSMNIAERRAFEHVASVCQVDVDRLCTDPSSRTVVQRRAEEPTMPRHSTSLLNLHHDMLRDLDAVLDSFLVAPPRHSNNFVLVYDSVPRSLNKNVPCPFENMLNEVLSFTPSELFMDVTKHMNIKGEQILMEQNREVSIHKGLLEKFNHDEHLVTMARRLQEVTPEHLYRRAFLPFGEKKNACLQQNLEKVSPKCAHAIRDLSMVRNREEQLNKEADDLANNIFILYFLLLSTICVAMYKARPVIRRQRWLLQRILRVVYSNPQIKEKVEKECRHQIGYTPPMVLRRRVRLPLLLRIIILATLFSCFVAPFIVVQLLCCVVGLSLWLVVFRSPKAQAQVCTCCCCGMTTEDAANSTEGGCCCPCCNGTGVCSLECANCCEDSDLEAVGDMNCSCCCGDGCCCCCGCGNTDKCCGGCCCCIINKSSQSLPKRTVLSVDKVTVYEGVPIQIV
jgi:hypothetical protein